MILGPQKRQECSKRVGQDACGRKAGKQSYKGTPALLVGLETPSPSVPRVNILLEQQFQGRQGTCPVRKGATEPAWEVRTGSPWWGGWQKCWGRSISSGYDDWSNSRCKANGGPVWVGCHAMPGNARQVKAECKHKEGDCLGCLDNVVLCASTCGGHAQATADSLMLLHWALLLWREES